MAELINNCSEDTSYVNIHGNDVRVLICNKTGRILIPIDELKETGFSIYRKSQYNKLLVDDAQFTKEFNLFMLQSAQTYMLQNKIVFKENEILESINNCKKLLAESPKQMKTDANTSSFFQNHVVKESSSNDLTITNHFKQPTAVQSVNSSEDRKTNNSRRSSTSSDSSRRSKNMRNSFDQKNNGEQRRSQNFNQATASPHNTIKQEEDNNKCEVRRPPLNHKNVSPREEVKPLASIMLEKEIHNVIVTSIDEQRPNAIWAQDEDNAETLIDIDRRIKEELKNARVVTRSQFNHVYLAQDEDSWFRCKVIKFRPLTVCFIDYGNTAEVSEGDLRIISQELAEIPAQAVKIILEDRHEPSLYDTIPVKIITRKEKGTYFATLASTEVQEVIEEEVVEKPQSCFFNKMPLQCSLQNGQKIMLIGEANGKLAVRTKDTYDKLKQIEELMKSTEFTPLPGGQPQKYQLVAVQHEDKWKRGEVVGIDGAKVSVALLDYPELIKVEPAQLRNITEFLHKEPMTYLMTPPLKGYEIGNERALEYIRELLKDKNKTKPTVILDKQEFDLKLDGYLLSERLNSLKNRVMLDDLKKYKPPMGKGTYMLYACRDVDNVTMVSQEMVEKYVDEVIKTELEDDDEELYVPIMGEVCLGMYQGSWSRCTIIRVMNARYEVKYIDFGNVEFLKAEQLKNLTPDGTNAPVLGVPCRFVGVPQVPNIDEILKETIVDGECYDLVVKRFDGTCYEIEAPEVYADIKRSN